MNVIMQRLGRFIWTNLGHCSSCMRKSFIAAICAWFCVLVITVSIKGLPTLTTIASVVATGLTFLWFAHLFVFTRKATRTLKENQISSPIESHTRRSAILSAAKVFAVGVTWSVAPKMALAGPTLIQCSCIGGKVTSGCCPTDSGNVCNCDDPKNPRIVCGQGSVYYGKC